MAMPGVAHQPPGGGCAVKRPDQTIAWQSQPMSKLDETSAAPWGKIGKQRYCPTASAQGDEIVKR